MLTERDIELKTKKILAENNSGQISIDLESLASSYNIKVVFEDFEDEISGLFLVKKGKFFIGINKHHHENRQRFTIAHELGHYFLHYNNEKNNLFVDRKATYFRDKNSSTGDDIREREANKFAAALLMPKDGIKNLIEDLNLNLSDSFDIYKLANKLIVSEKALTIRLLRLKLIEHY